MEAPALEGPFLAAGFAFCCLEGLAVGFDFGCLAAGFRSSSSSEALPSHSSSPSSLEESMVRFAFGMALYVGEDRAEKGARARARRSLALSGLRLAFTPAPRRKKRTRKDAGVL